MRSLEYSSTSPTARELEDLAKRCKPAHARMRSGDSEIQFPVFIEFAGSPKSGKTTIIGILGHFFKRMGFHLAMPAEGASLRTPPGLRDDWLAFNAWSGCYALQQLLIDCHTDPPVEMVFLDRGLFDVAAWMEFLSQAGHRITDDDRDRITAFFTLDLWRRRENLVFLFTADHKTSLARENDSKLTTESGSVMNEETLGTAQ